MPKLIIQIPCLNEAATLPQTLADLPTSIVGVDKIELQVIDDGSTDGTADVARSLGVHHIVRFKKNRGLAAAFKAGVDNAIAQGADILVNTDADNQYSGADIERLVQPVLLEGADMVVGCRPISMHPDFSFLKKLLQRVGSWVLRSVSRTDVEDAASGFRAYSRDALLRLNVFSDFSYCMETLIQGGHDNLRIVSCPISVNPKTRESRLFRSLPHYLWRSGTTIISIFLLYRATKLFGTISALMMLACLLLVLRYLVLVLVFGASGASFWPSIVLAGALLMAAFVMYLTGLLASLMAANRKLLEEIAYRLRRLDIGEHD